MFVMGFVADECFEVCNVLSVRTGCDTCAVIGMDVWLFLLPQSRDNHG